MSERRATSVPGETKGELVRRHILRIVGNAGGWVDMREVVKIGRDEAGWTPDLLDWVEVALREAVANGDLDRSDSNWFAVRLTEKGERAKAINDALEVKV